MICAIESFNDFERFARLKKTWLRRFLKLPHVRFIRPDLRGEPVAIDSITLRHSFFHGDPESSLHLISAWANYCGPALG